jgi:hypothetical protein
MITSNAAWSRNKFYDNTQTEELRNDLSFITISIAKLCVYRGPRTNEHSVVSMQRLYVMCELWRDYKLVGI